MYVILDFIMITTSIQAAKTILDSDGVIGFPTETVYGLAANIFSEKAIKSIFELKNRPTNNPLIVHIHSIDQLSEIVEDVTDNALLLMKEFWPGPLTLILPKKKTISSLVTGGKDTVAVRMPNHALALDLLRTVEFPLAAPSANPFSSISPTSAQHVATYFGEKVPVILDGGQCEFGIESTILGFENDKMVLYRKGSIPIESIEKTIGYIPELKSSNQQIKAPGMYLRHYAPTTQLRVVENSDSAIMNIDSTKIGLITLAPKITHSKVCKHVVLSSTGSLEEAAYKLYSTFHLLDQLELDLIFIEKFPENGIGSSLNDRIERASFTNK